MASQDATVPYLLRLGDSALILGQRVSEWCGHGPMLEEDIAMANIGLDLIGHARLLLTLAGSRMDPPQTEDQLAYWRNEPQFHNWTLCELPNSGLAKGQQTRDYAVTITRNLLYSGAMLLLWEALQCSTDADLAAIASKAVKESRYHFRHARDWIVRFGDGTAESRQRAQNALDHLMPYAAELFEDDTLQRSLHAQGLAPLHASLLPHWDALIDAALTEATLTRPAPVAFRSTGAQGRHSEHFGFLLAEMQSLARAHPGVTW
jgi:ring-1,2-phenylacetyl-CoA epoxidase subunit PaaC